MSLLIAAAALYSRGAATVPADTAEPAMNTGTTPDPEEQARQEALAAKRADALSRAQTLAQQYFYDEAIAALSDAELECDEIAAACAELENEKAALVDYTDDIPHIFLHSLIVYPEMIFTDLTTPMGGYNSGFSEKAEFEKILPQLYERGYVLYDLDKLWVKQDGKMVRQKIMLPEGKTPLILSVDDVAYAYGDGYAQQLFVDDSGELMYRVNNPSGGVDIIPDGDVMGVVDAFVAEHPDFSWNGHKGTIALTGFQGAFGYPSYDDPAYQTEIKKVADALRADGWSFASHSYTHNSGVYGFWGTGCIPDKIYYDINKWVDRVSPWIGETNLFLAPFGYRATGEALQHVLNAGFNIYCTVDDHVVNELYDNYALQSRIEIGGYSMTYYRDILNELFFDVDSVLDPDRPPVVYDE